MTTILSKDGDKLVDCNGCTACCQWGGDPRVAPRLSKEEAPNYKHAVMPSLGIILDVNPDTGGCVYLGEEGCTIWATRPKQCREFDCEDVLNIALGGPQRFMVNVIVAAIKRQNKESN